MTFKQRLRFTIAIWRHDWNTKVWRSIPYANTRTDTSGDLLVTGSISIRRHRNHLSFEEKGKEEESSPAMWDSSGARTTEKPLVHSHRLHRTQKCVQFSTRKYQKCLLEQPGKRCCDRLMHLPLHEANRQNPIFVSHKSVFEQICLVAWNKRMSWTEILDASSFPVIAKGFYIIDRRN